MKLKYRIAAILAAAVTALSLTSCGSPQQSSQQTTATQKTEPSTVPVAVVDKDKTYDYDVREIWCENDGQKIYGQAFVPETDGRSPLIITSHGLGANHESGASYAKNTLPRASRYTPSTSAAAAIRTTRTKATARHSICRS